MFPQMFPGVGKIINQLISVNCYFTYFFLKSWDTFELHLGMGTHMLHIWEGKGHNWDTFGMSAV